VESSGNPVTLELDRNPWGSGEACDQGLGLTPLTEISLAENVSLRVVLRMV